MRRLPLLLCLLPALLVLSGAGQPGVQYTLSPDSHFQINGTSTLGKYRCETSQAVGSGRARSTDPLRATATLTVPVLTFDCGRGAMNRDFYNALKADAHPAIRIAIDDAKLLERPADDTWTPVTAQGALRLAGTERDITLQAEGRRRADGSVQIRGGYGLKMSDYGIDPPSGLLGLVRAHDAVVVSFNLVAVAE